MKKMNFKNGSSWAMLAWWKEYFGHTFEANSNEPSLRHCQRKLKAEGARRPVRVHAPRHQQCSPCLLRHPGPTLTDSGNHHFVWPLFFKLMSILIWYTRAGVKCNCDVCRARGRTVTTCHCLGTPCLAPTPPPPLASARLPQRAAWATLTRTTRLQILAMTPSQALHFLRQPSSRISWCLELGTTMSGDEGWGLRLPWNECNLCNHNFHRLTNFYSQGVGKLTIQGSRSRRLSRPWEVQSWTSVGTTWAPRSLWHHATSR